MKKRFILILVVAFLVPTTSFAFEVDLAPLANDEFFYARTFDNLVLDFIIVPDEVDFLRALTVENLGTARNVEEIKKIILYADNGNNSFDGFGLDELVSQGNYISQNKWYFSNFDIEIPVTGRKFYVTIETEDRGIDDYTFRFKIPEYYNLSNDNSFQVSDRGIFLESGIEAPIEDLEVNVGSKYKYLSTDTLPTVSVITNTFDGDIIPTGDYTILGKSRDQGGSATEYVYVCMDVRCVKPVDLGQYYSDWRYVWTDVEAGDHEIYLKSRDYGSQEIIETEKITVTAQSGAIIDMEKTTFDVDKTQIVGNDFDFAVLTVEVYDTSGSIVVGQEVEMLTDSSTVNFDKISVNTDTNGRAIFVVKSTVKQSVKIWPKINGNQSSNYITLNFVDASQVDIDSTNSNNSSAINYYQGKWVKTQDNTAVYHLDNNNVRHAYPVQAVWETYWGHDFSRVETISAQEMSGYNLGVNVPFAVGSLMKLPSVPRVYKVEAGRVIRWIGNESVAGKLYGNNWAETVNNLPDSFLEDYIEGDIISL